MEPPLYSVLTPPNGAKVKQKALPVEDHDIPELTHKVIASAKVARYSEHEQELSFEFTDGTSFCFSACSRVSAELSVYKGGVGQPDVIRALKVD